LILVAAGLPVPIEHAKSRSFLFGATQALGGAALLAVVNEGCGEAFLLLGVEIVYQGAWRQIWLR